MLTIITCLCVWFIMRWRLKKMAQRARAAEKRADELDIWFRATTAPFSRTIDCEFTRL